MTDASPQFGNLLMDIPSELPDEFLQPLVQTGGLRIERIISRGHSSPPDFWYDQEQEEWVVLVAGGATLRFEQPARIVELQPGDYVRIPAHCRHRVERTSTDPDAVWLAVHYDT